MNGFQLSINNVEENVNLEDIPISSFYYSLGMKLYETYIPNLEFIACEGGYSFAYLYRSLCRCHEWSLSGTRFQLSGDKIVSHSIEHAPGYGFGAVSGIVALSNHVVILQNEMAKKLLEDHMETFDQNGELIMDHGLRSGLWLFDSLAKQYIDVYEKMRKEYSISFLSFRTKEDGGLKFCFDQWNVYVYLAHCLFLHDKMEKYIKEKEKRIAIKENPMLFLLVFCEYIFPQSFYKSSLCLDRKKCSKLKLQIIDCVLFMDLSDKQIEEKEVLEGIEYLESLLQIRWNYDEITKKIQIQIE